MRNDSLGNQSGRPNYPQSMHVDGYMIRAEYDGARLCLDGTNRAAQVALRGPEAGQGPLILPVEDIAAVELKAASVLANGKMVVTTRDGRRYQAHFRRKQQADWDRLVAALGI